MSPAPQHSLAVVCLVVLRVAAFIPGGIKTGAPGSQPQKQAKDSLKMTIAPRYGDGDALYQALALPMELPIMATSVINEWAKAAATSAVQTLRQNDSMSEQFVHETQYVLSLIRNRIRTKDDLQYIFALTTGSGLEDIQAIATVAPRPYRGIGSAGKVGRIVGVHEIVAKPSADSQRNLAKLVRRIRGWATQCCVGINIDLLTEEQRKYYQLLGVQPGHHFGTTYGGDIVVEALRQEGFRMKTLKIATVAPMRASWRASAVIQAWTREANIAMSGPAAKNPKALRSMKNMMVALHLMDRTVAAGIPYVFALATGEGMGGIQAMATVTTQVGWDDRLSGNRVTAVVEVRELVARPGAEGGRTLITELLSRIQNWAAGRFFTIAFVAELGDYYKGLGFVQKEMVLPGAGAELPKPLAVEEYRMLILEPEARPEHARQWTIV